MLCVLLFFKGDELRGDEWMRKVALKPRRTQNKKKQKKCVVYFHRKPLREFFKLVNKKV